MMTKKLGMVGVSWGSPQPLKALYSKGLMAFLRLVGVNVNIDRKEIINMYYSVLAPANISSPTPTFTYIYDNTTLTRLGMDFYPQLPQPKMLLHKTVISNSVKNALVDIGMSRFTEFSSHLKANDVDWIVESMDSLFPTSNLKVVGLNGWIEKDTALSAFKEIYQDDRITKSKLTKELILHGIRTGEINDKRVYRWD